MPKRLLLLISLMLFALPVSNAQEPIVYGVFFYSPTCPHCHEVMENHWPAIAAHFGEQLQVVFVDVTSQAGRELMETAIWALNLQSGGVPQLIIGEDVMVGSIEIPQRAPLLIQAGLDAGGIPYPAIPNIEAWFSNAGMVSPTLASFNPLGTLSADPANSLAIIVLVSMALSLSLVTWAGWQTIVQNQRQLLQRLTHELGWWALIIGILLSFAVVLSLLFGSSSSLVVALAVVEAGLLIFMLVLISKKSTSEALPRLLIPLLMLLGVMASAYLSYVEMSLTEPVCGAWGDCLAVQQSSYSHIAGMPMSLIGLLAYTLMLLLHLGRKLLGRSADTLLFGSTVVGLIFSLYLTFLEPFVIGASCAWCLTSALVMLNLFWIIVPNGLARLAVPQKHYA